VQRAEILKLVMNITVLCTLRIMMGLNPTINIARRCRLSIGLSKRHLPLSGTFVVHPTYKISTDKTTDFYKWNALFPLIFTSCRNIP